MEKFFDQPIKNDKVTKILEKLLQVKEMLTRLAVFQTIPKKYYKLIAIDLSKHQALDADPKAIQQINLQQIQIDQIMRDSISFLKKKKKLFLNFNKEL